MNHDRCGSYDCAPARREEASSEPKLLISAADLEQCAPLPSRRLSGSFTPPISSPQKPRTNRLAIAAFVCALAGIPFFGAVTGLVAILLGSLALGAIRSSPQRGLGLALGGVLLGLGDVVGWIIFLSGMLSGHAADVDVHDMAVDQSISQDFAPKIRRAMQANVLIERRTGWGALGGTAIGSGVILAIEHGEALIVTNRHVIDPNFPGHSAPPDLEKLSDRSLTVKLLGQPSQRGRVVWVAPEGADLALVRVTAHSKESRAAKWQKGRPTHIGDPVYAIGNPQGLSWTHTQGAISQFRTLDLGERPIRVIQTQAAINPGNSGGGLYDDTGYLIGINSLTYDKRVSEGLSFAIAFDSLLELAPPGLDADHEELKENDQP
jgi:S1-C subfamily serine protease